MIGLSTLSHLQKDILIQVLMNHIDLSVRRLLIEEYPAIYAQLTGVFIEVKSEVCSVKYPNTGYQANNYSLKAYRHQERQVIEQ